MTKNEALRLALEALEFDSFYGTSKQEAITAIKAALEAKDEPVAWMHIQGNYKEPSLGKLDNYEIKRGWEQYPLYTTPPQRTWVGLTNQELSDCWDTIPERAMKQVEAKLKEKNT